MNQPTTHQLGRDPAFMQISAANVTESPGLSTNISPRAPSRLLGHHHCSCVLCGRPTFTLTPLRPPSQSLEIIPTASLLVPSWKPTAGRTTSGFPSARLGNSGAPRTCHSLLWNLGTVCSPRSLPCWTVSCACRWHPVVPRQAAALTGAPVTGLKQPLIETILGENCAYSCDRVQTFPPLSLSPDDGV